MTALEDLWDFDAPETSAERFRARLEGIDAERDPTDAAETLTQLARAEGLARRPEVARQLLDRAEALLDRAGPVARVRWRLERGRLRNSFGDRAAARTDFEIAWQEALEAALDALAVDAAHMAAIAAGDDAEEAMRWNRLALELAAASSEPRARRWRGSLENNVGWTLHAAGRPAEALPHFEAALAARLEEGEPRPIGIARWCIARCLRSLGRIEEALAMQQELHRAEDRDGSGFVEEELGECLLALGRTDEARPWFALAHERLSADPWLREREPERIARLRTLAGDA